MVRVVKKDHTKEPFNIQKVVIAVNKSANRVLYNFTEDELKSICNHVEGYIRDHHMTEIQIWQMHNIVESALESVQPEVAKSYRDYRNYKQDFVGMLDSVYQKSQSIMYIGDKENSNTDSALVSTKRSLIFNQLNKELYQKFFMNTEELQACRDGYIYVHDMSARRDTMNCCLFDVASVLKDGFEMGNLWYNEPKTLNVAFDVIGDIVLSAASQQYGGFTVPSVDLLLEPYAERSYKMLTLLENSVNLLRTHHQSGEVYYWILYYSFLSPQKLKNVEEIIEALRPHIRDISFSTYYRLRKAAVEALSSVLWGFSAQDTLKTLDCFFPPDV